MVITLHRNAALDSVRPTLEAMLEQEYEGHTEALAALIEHRRRRTVVDLEAVTADVRQALADVASALRRMAEGSYGTCERCAGDIEMDYLQMWPAVRYCRACTPQPVA
jgi:RNA polymerase-binding transcription factor DksA